MAEWRYSELESLLDLLTKVRNGRRFWPDEVTFQMAHQIIPVPATEVAVVKDRKLLLQYRTFAEWPTPYNRPGWYIPGGYYSWLGNTHDACTTHLRKDLQNEYKRVGEVEFDLASVVLSEPVCIHVKKWMPGEHPFGAPVSVVCVCELLKGDIVETDWLKWSDQVIPTDVPHHEHFQWVVRRWVNSSEECRHWYRSLGN